MKLAHIQLDTVLDFPLGKITSLVVENKRFFRELIGDISRQIDGGDGACVLSEDDKKLNFAKCVELMDSFVTFNINTKSLQTKILAALEKSAVNSDRYVECMELLSSMEKFVFNLTQDCTADIICGKLSINAVLKAIGITVNNDYDDPLERLIDYMELVREYDRDKLFVFVNLRAYFSDEELQPFFETVLAHEYQILLLESVSGNLLPFENRLTVDDDLCEF